MLMVLHLLLVGNDVIKNFDQMSVYLNFYIVFKSILLMYR